MSDDCQKHEVLKYASWGPGNCEIKTKNSMNYFSKVTSDHWTAKNKAEAAAKELARSMERMHFPDSQLSNFLRVMEEGIKGINQTYPRCKPLKLEIWKPWEHISDPGNNRDIDIYVSDVFQLSLYEVKSPVILATSTE
jgi:hypothetical protein